MRRLQACRAPRQLRLLPQLERGERASRVSARLLGAQKKRAARACDDSAHGLGTSCAASALMRRAA